MMVDLRPFGILLGATVRNESHAITYAKEQHERRHRDLEDDDSKSVTLTLPLDCVVQYEGLKKAETRWQVDGKISFRISLQDF